jgi:hypothetical protein
LAVLAHRRGEHGTAVLATQDLHHLDIGIHELFVVAVLDV